MLLEGLWSHEAEKLGVDRNERELCVIGSTSVMDELKSLSAIRKESLFRLSLFIILSFSILILKNVNIFQLSNSISLNLSNRSVEIDQRYVSLCVTFRGGSRTAATSKMEHFAIIVSSLQSLTIITKRSILDVLAVLDPPLTLSRKPSKLIM